jgi:hypothetical protein
LIKDSFDSIPALAKSLIDNPKYDPINLPELNTNRELTNWTNDRN